MMVHNESLICRVPRTMAALTFAAAAIIHTIIVVVLVGRPVSVLMPVVYVLVHALAGACEGRMFVDPACTPTPRRAAVRGMAVMLLALLFLWIATLAIVLPSSSLRHHAVEWFEEPSAGNAFYAITTMLGLAYLSWIWWLLPLGALAGWYLYTRSRRGMVESIGD